MSDANNAASGESPNVDRSAPIPGSLSNLGNLDLSIKEII